MQDWDYFDLHERRPQLWEAFCRFAVANGVGPDHSLQDRPPMPWYAHHQGGLNFVETVERQLSEGCAQVFMAIHTEHSMRQAILTTPTPRGTTEPPARARARRQAV